jgi:hypothetical protein
MDQEPFAEIGQAEMSAAQVNRLLKELSEQRSYFERCFQTLNRKIAVAKVQILILAVAFSAASVVTSLLLVRSIWSLAP